MRLPYQLYSKKSGSSKKRTARQGCQGCERKGGSNHSSGGVTLKDIQSIDYSWGEIEFEVSPMKRLMKACAPAPAACEEACYDMDIVPDDIEVADTVTIV